jgi:cytidine deaminase
MRKEFQIFTEDSLAMSALAAANNSYAPYTGTFSGVALETGNGMTFTGRDAENAAYNPSLMPLQSALAHMNMKLPPQSAFDIARVVLVERNDAPISQKAATEAVMASVAPDIALDYHTAH